LTLSLNYHQQVVLLSLLSMVSFALFLVFYLPIQALLALSVCASSTSLLFYVAYRHGLQQFQQMQQSQGLGVYLPGWLYQQLTQTTLHEYLQDTTLFTEYQHILLYFLPNITTQQLDWYVNRLPPRHRDTLYRHGLGHLFGEDFMRFLMGQERYNQMLINTYQQDHREGSGDGGRIDNREVVIVPPPRARAGPPLLIERAAAGDASDLESTESNTAGMPRSTPNNNSNSNPTTTVITPRDVLRLTSMPSTQEGLERELSGENAVLSDAFMGVMQSYAASMVASAHNALQQSWAGWIVRSGWSLTAASAGLGALRLLGSHRPTSSSTTQLRIQPYLPSNTLLISTAVVGGLTAGALQFLRRFFQFWKDSLTTDETNSTSKKENKEKKTQ